MISVRVEFSKEAEEIIRFLTNFKDNKGQLAVVALLYMYYLQYQSYYTATYKKYSGKEYELSRYLSNISIRWLRVSLVAIYKVLKELILWVLMGGFCVIITDLHSAYNVLLLIELPLFFTVFYLYLFNKIEPLKTTLKILIFYNIIVTAAVYAFQLVKTDYFVKHIFDVNSLSTFYRDLLVLIGFEDYRKNLKIEMLPYYGSNLLSTFIYKMVVFQLEDSKQEEEEREVVEEYGTFKYVIYNTMSLLCKYFWIAIFTLSFLIMIYQEVSFTLFLYLLAYYISFISLFKSFANKSENKRKYKLLFSTSKLLRYKAVELKKHAQIFLEERKNSFSWLIFLGMTCISLYYCYAFTDRYFVEIIKEPKSEVLLIVRKIAILLGCFGDREFSFSFNCKNNYLLILFVVLDIYCNNLEIWLNKRLEAMENDASDTVKRELQKKLIAIEKEKENLDESEIQLEDDTKSIDLNKGIDVNDSSYIPQGSVLNKIVKVFERFSQSMSADVTAVSFNFRLKFLTSTKFVFEEIIIFLLFLTAIFKMNILSFVYLALVFVIQRCERSIKNLLILFRIVGFLMVLQYFVMVGDHNWETYPNPNFSDNLKELFPTSLHEDWGLERNWAYFLTFNVEKFQYNSLILEFVTTLFFFAYFDFYTFSIFETGKQKGVNYSTLAEEDDFAEAVKLLEPEEHKKIQTSLKSNFGIEVPSISELNELVDEVQGEGKESEETPEECRLREEKEKKLKMKKEQRRLRENWLTDLLNLASQFVYLNFHIVSLVFLLILFLQNRGLVSAFYIIFAVFNLFYVKNFALLLPWSYPKQVRTFLIVFIWCDVASQFIIQNPLNYYIDDGESADVFSKIAFITLRILGVNKVIEYGDSITFDEESRTTLIIKVVSFLMISFQVSVYDSLQFKNFIVNYIIVKSKTSSETAKMTTYLYNNARIEGMSKSLKNRDNVYKILNRVQDQMTEWNKKLSNQNEEKLEEADVLGESEEIKTDEEIFNERMRETIMGNWWVKLGLWVNKTFVNLIYIGSTERKVYAERIQKGDTYLPCFIEKTIDFFLNTIDYSMLVFNISNQIDEKKKKKEEEEAQKDKEMNKIINSTGDVLPLEEEQLQNAEEEGEVEEQVEEKEEAQVSVKSNEMNADLSDSDCESEERDKVSVLRNLVPGKELEQKPKKKREFDESVTYSEAQLEKEQKQRRLDHAKRIMEAKGIDLKYAGEDQYLKIVNEEFFKDYLSKLKIVSFCLRRFIFYMFENFDYVVYIIMILNHFENANLLSVVYPLAVFSYGLIINPRPSKWFWLSVKSYNFAVIALKYLVQQETFRYILGVNPSVSTDDTYIIGVRMIATDRKTEFLNYIFWDCFLAFFITLHELNIINKGFYMDTEKEIENLKEAIYRVRNIKSSSGRSSVMSEQSFLGQTQKKDLSLFDRIYEDPFPTLRVRF